MKFRYDKEGDILYAIEEGARGALYDPAGNGVFIRVDPVTNEIIGFYIIDYANRKARGALPKVPHFESLKLPEPSELVW